MKTKQITIPQPCSQSWEEMLPQDGGRFCNSCQKTVIDFTDYDDESFIAYFQQAKTIPCGRVTTRQLNLSVPSQQFMLLRPVKLYKYATAGLLSLVSIPAATWAQQTVETSVHFTTTSDLQKSVSPDKGDIIELKGKVVDESGAGLPGVSVSLLNADTAVVTDIDGSFSLNINKNESTSVLQVWALGYGQKEIDLSAYKNNSTITLAASMLGGIQVYTKRSLWHRLTKPFRSRH